MAGKISRFKYVCPKCGSEDFYVTTEVRVGGNWLGVKSYNEHVYMCRTCDIKLNAISNPEWVAAEASRKAAEEAKENNFESKYPGLYRARNILGIVGGVLGFIPTPVTWGIGAALFFSAWVIHKRAHKLLKR